MMVAPACVGRLVGIQQRTVQEDNSIMKHATDVYMVLGTSRVTSLLQRPSSCCWYIEYCNVVTRFKETFYTGFAEKIVKFCHKILLRNMKEFGMQCQLNKCNEIYQFQYDICIVNHTRVTPRTIFGTYTINRHCNIKIQTCILQMVYVVTPINGLKITYLNNI